MPDSEPVRQVKRTLNVLVAATVVLYLAVGVAVGLTYSSNSRTQDALCTLREDLQRRVAQTQDFLIKHPEGFAGIPTGTIRQGLVNQQHTIEALSSLSC